MPKFTVRLIKGENTAMVRRAAVLARARDTSSNFSLSSSSALNALTTRTEERNSLVTPFRRSSLFCTVPNRGYPIRIFPKTRKATTRIIPAITGACPGVWSIIRTKCGKQKNAQMPPDVFRYQLHMFSFPSSSRKILPLYHIIFRPENNCILPLFTPFPCKIPSGYGRRNPFML